MEQFFKGDAIEPHTPESSEVLSEQDKHFLEAKQLAFEEYKKTVIDQKTKEVRSPSDFSESFDIKRVRIGKEYFDHIVESKVEISEEEKALFVDLENDPQGILLRQHTWKVSQSITAAIEAVVDKNPDNQPLGVVVAELAKQNNLPVVMVTAQGHVQGQEMVLIVNMLLKKENVLNGTLFDFEKIEEGVRGKEYTKDDFPEYASSDLFFVPKYHTEPLREVLYRKNGQYEDYLKEQKEKFHNRKTFTSYNNFPLSWQLAFDRIQEKIGQKDQYRILVVEDNPINMDALRLSLSEGIEDGKLELVHAPDFETAQVLLEGNKGKVDGVVTDLNFPEKLGSSDKSHGEQVFLELAEQYMDKGEAELLLQKAKKEYKKTQTKK